jgi:hypothetical protein
MTELSPAAQSVLDALCMDELNGPQQLMARAHAAAALRAAADQMSSHHSKAYLYSLADGLKLLAIANELQTQ